MTTDEMTQKLQALFDSEKKAEYICIQTCDGESADCIARGNLRALLHSIIATNDQVFDDIKAVFFAELQRRQTLGIPTGIKVEIAKAVPVKKSQNPS